jgi:hypothetical protein
VPQAILLIMAMDFKVSCSKIPHCAFIGIRTHDLLVDVLTIRPRCFTSILLAQGHLYPSLFAAVISVASNLVFGLHGHFSCRIGTFG